MKVAIVGAGASGLTTAWLLQDQHDVTVFEAGPRRGGHVHTVTVAVDGRRFPVELGAEFFFQDGYPGMHALLGRLGVRNRPDRIGATVALPSGRTTVLPPRTLPAVATCFVPRTAWDLAWFGRLAQASRRVLAERDTVLTFGGLLARCGIRAGPAHRLLVPLVASSWGVDCDVAQALSAYAVVRVTNIADLGPPHTFGLEGGLSSYIDALAADAPRVTTRLATPVRAVHRRADDLVVATDAGNESFDAVVLASDWATAARLCAGSPHLERWSHAFSAFEDYPARLALHRDRARMPRRRSLWQAIHYRLTAGTPPRSTVWSGRTAKADVFRSWLAADEPLPAGTTHEAHYRHILVTPVHFARQAAVRQLQGTAGVYAAGMYTTGVDNHESALRSAISVARHLAPTAERVTWFDAQVSD